MADYDNVINQYEGNENDGRGVEPLVVSETPYFDAVFGRYDNGSGAFGTEHLGSLLLDMGFNASSRLLDRALDDMDPDATGEIGKLAFLEWFEKNADDIDPPQATTLGSPQLTPRSPSKQQDSIQQLQSAMLDAKNLRKVAEADAQILANRLAHLRAEDARAQKRIEEANRRAKEIEAIKKRNQEHQRAKLKAMEQMQMEIKATCEYNNMVQLSARERRQQNASELSSIRAKIVQETKRERLVNLAKIQHKREVEKQTLCERSKEIRNQEKSALKRRELIKKQHENELIKKSRDSLALECQKKIMSEKLIQKMEIEEAQLIEKLRITQEMQRTAYEHLEFVMQD